jgi:putative ATPase
MKKPQMSVITGGKYGIDWQRSLSKNGHVLAEVRSALIKEIRRGKEKKALYWMLEMSGADARVDWAVWNDLRVFALEDVGLAEPQALGVINAALELHRDLSLADPRRQLCLAHAVCYLARCRKTRFVNELLSAVVDERKNGVFMNIPDYALDMHTCCGRRLGRGLEHYLTFAATSENEAPEFSRKWRRRSIKRARK